jgi:hypothetical protein
MFRNARLAGFASVVGSLALAPAASAVNLSIGSLQMVNKLYVNVPVTYSCADMTSGLYPYSYGSVSLEQTNNKAIAEGSVAITPLCDGTSHTDVVQVYPTISGYTSTGVPFKPGAAVATAFLYDCSTDPLTYQQICDNFSTGPMAVKISNGNS